MTEPPVPAGSGHRRPDLAELRLAVLAVSVLDDLDLEPRDDGVRLQGTPPVDLPWSECLRALAGHEPAGRAGRQRLSGWLRARRQAADLPHGELVERLRPVGLPVEHLLHPGLDWVRERVLGDALDLGLGAVGLDPADPDGVVLLPQTALDAADVDTGITWPGVRTMLEDRGAVAASLVARDAKGLLRPVGGCDAVTLLGARSLRTTLASGCGGLTTAVVPMRARGWTRLALVDPAFALAAAAATDPADRGFDRPLLVTADEVVLAAAGGRPEVLGLADAAPAGSPWGREVLHRWP